MGAMRICMQCSDSSASVLQHAALAVEAKGQGNKQIKSYAHMQTDGMGGGGGEGSALLSPSFSSFYCCQPSLLRFIHLSGGKYLGENLSGEHSKRVHGNLPEE